MTKQESFKRRIRERMGKTGERYAAARRALIEDSGDGTRKRTWVAEPEMSDDAIRSGTGKGWEEWCDTIEVWGGQDQGHTAIAKFIREDCGVDAWWSQGVTVGFERITGLRLPYQRPDGTFEANKSKTITGSATALRKMLLDDDLRGDLFPHEETTLLSRPSAKAIRISVGPGTAQFGLEEKADGRVKVVVAHRGLAEFSDVEEWKYYWADWLDAIDGT